jgi:hypothetical protein
VVLLAKTKSVSGGTESGSSNGGDTLPKSRTSAQLGGSPFSLHSGVLPTGITLSSSGVLSGTTTSLGSDSFTVQAGGLYNTYTMQVVFGTDAYGGLTAPGTICTGTGFFTC